MQWFGNLKTRTKLIAGFGVVCVIMAAVGLFAVRELAVVNSSTVEIATNWLPSVKITSELNTGTFDHRLKLLRYISASSPDERAQLEREMAATETQIAKDRAVYEPLISSPEEQAKYDQFSTMWEGYLRGYAEIVALSRQGKPAEAKALLVGASLSDFRTTSAKIGELVALNDTGGQVARATAATAYTRARTWLIGIITGGIAIACVLALVIAGIIARPLAMAVDILQAVADGDFTRTLEVDTEDEVGQMAAALNRAVGGMRGALTEVRRSADELASASQQLSAASEEISSGAQEQAAGLEETASSLEEITSTVKQNADNAQQANQLASGAGDVAEKGGRVVNQAVVAMGEINQASKQIADIITTIDEIAFQTNLLALNAAVEAARAGEQGRGFAVVAAEVRNLAQRSATAAKEIKGLIQDSVSKVEAGSALVNQSGQTLQEIVQSVKRVTDIVAEIAAATKEQATGIDQVNRAISQMDSVTQSNASQTEELSGTAESLSTQAEELQGLVARFRLEQEGTTGHRVAPPAARVKPRKPPVAAARRTTAVAARRPARPAAFPSLDDEVPVAAAAANFEEF